VAQTPVGHEVKLTVLRVGLKEQVTVTIGSLEKAETVIAAVVKERLGAEVRVPTTKEVEQYGLKENQGVVITRLEAKGPLAAAGFEVGDMILAVDEQPVEGTGDFIGLVSALPPGKRASLTALDHKTGNTGNIFVVVQ
jgi:serine protease Do